MAKNAIVNGKKYVNQSIFVIDSHVLVVQCNVTAKRFRRPSDRGHHNSDEKNRICNRKKTQSAPIDLSLY